MSRQRLSFASVAAMASPSKQTVPVANGPSDSGKLPSDTMTVPNSASGEVAPASNPSPGLNESLSRLDLKDGQVPVPDVPEHELQVVAPLQLRPQLEDEKTHLSFSSNKASSLDGKSVASVATFAMDEKESIRPDDSASVKAADDDDSNSGPASGAPNSRVGSEAGTRAFGNQFTEISERMAPGMFRPGLGVRRPGPGASEDLRRTQSGGQIPIIQGRSMSRPEAAVGVATAPFVLPAVPDEKILEAMHSPKDRLFLLGLEQQIIVFIGESSDPVLNLPPCNSFCRLLAHRLGDYYALGHVLDNSQSAVQLHRTPHCQLRPPLANFDPPKPVSTTASGAAGPSMRIMRRADLSTEGRVDGSGTNTTENSVGPSQAASEADSDNQKASGLVSPAESSSAKDKTTSREEREAKYKEARERIFADYKESDSNDQNQSDAGNDASRASSTNGRKKNKKKNTHDDSFDSRSSYNVFYPSNQRSGPVYEQSGQNVNFVPPFMPQSNNPMFNNGFVPNYSQQYPQMQPTPGYHVPMQPQTQPQMQMSMQMTGMPGMYNGQGAQQPYAQYPQQMPGYYPQMHQHNNTGPQQPPTMPSPASSNHSGAMSRPQSQMSDQGWNQNMYQSQYPGYSNPQMHYGGQSQQTALPQMNQGQVNQGSVPYQYGQLPYQPSGQSARPIHPIPGSYSRQPQFNNAPGRPPMDTNAFRSATQAGALSMNNMNNYQMPQQIQMSPNQQFSPNFSSQHVSQRKPGATTPQSQSPNQSTLSKWGTPPTLPPKPPPPASSHSGMQSSSGLPVPTYQNGTYSNTVSPATESI